MNQCFDPGRPSVQNSTSYPIRFLDWDTRFFGAKMGAVDLSLIPAYNYSESVWQTTVSEAKQAGYQFLLCQIDASAQDFANRILKSGARIGDILMTFRRKLAPADLQDSGAWEIREATQRDLPVLFTMAADSFDYSRFLQDPRFDRDKSRQLYQNWLAESYRNEQVLVAKRPQDFDSAVLGFVSFGLDAAAHLVVIRLLATQAEARGAGLGKSLMARVFDLAWQSGAQEIQVGTQFNNYGAIRFYEKEGFRCHNLKYRFHFWLDEV